MLVTACGTAPTEEAGGDEGPPVRGGHLTYLDYQPLKSFQLSDLNWYQAQPIANNVFDRLVFRPPSGTEIKPWIATSWTTSEDGRRYTFTLRDGVTYSDGTPLDAENVKQNFEFRAFGDDKGNVKHSAWPEVAAISADNAKRSVTVELTRPYPYFLTTLSDASASGLAASSYFAKDARGQNLATSLVGSGPFVIESGTLDEVKLVRRPGYAWAPAGVTNQGEAYLDSFSTIGVTEDSVRLGSLSSDQGDLIHYVEPSSQRVAEAQGLRLITQSYADQGTYLLVQRSSAPHLGDVRVRQAITYAVDKQKLIDTVYAPNYRAATGLFGSGGQDFVDQSDKVSYQPERANQLLDQAGWRRGDDGIRVKDGQRLKLVALIDVYTVGAPSTFEYLQQQLKQAGIEVVLRQVDWADYPNAAKSPDVGLIYQSVNHEAAWSLANAIRADGADTFKLKGSDAQLETLTRSVLYGNPKTENERRSAAVALSQYVIDNAYVLPLTERTQTFVSNSKVHGFTQTQGHPWLYLTWKNQ
ncbi:ABC transporter substrate-binding protein [Gordonia sp. ABSL1-1]|uniref:ABC transporter substrate-binding protein n=1 Tax=Gordonia sp. ABSL1-1 TaxID=3053923 RepID=UPI002573FC1B|nr:ABC transporter substrate-binding protein [Gordonia sp. ABSL1-1]MDL9935463.1 ABC transporter substrate-binding protein [Gordonia sp. ABSL1-1]